MRAVARALYDGIGRTYVSTRQPDLRIAAAIWKGFGDAETVLNVGSGAGSYEPAHLQVTALEPSDVMIAQRPAGAAPVIRGSAEDLPFADNSFDVACAILSDHHWTDRAQGLRELRRVARRKVVLFNADPAEFDLFWMNRDYLPWFGAYLLPDAYRVPGFWRNELKRLLGRIELTPVPIPHDCVDGFYGAYWRRPEAYLDPVVRDGISVFAKLPGPKVASAIDQLNHDLASGAWHRRHSDLVGLDALHLGYYVAVAEIAGT